MPKVIGFDPVDLGFGGMINYSGKNNNKVLAKVKGGSYPKLGTPNAAPVWITASGSLGTFYTGNAINISLTATDPDDDVLTYAGTNIPAGLTLNTSTGALTGTVSTASTYNFDVTTSDGVANPVTRSFSMNVETLTEVYLNVFTGNDTNDGTTSDTAVSTIGVAVGKIPDNGTVYLTSVLALNSYQTPKPYNLIGVGDQRTVYRRTTGAYIQYNHNHYAENIDFRMMTLFYRLTNGKFYYKNCAFNCYGHTSFYNNASFVNNSSSHTNHKVYFDTCVLGTNVKSRRFSGGSDEFAYQKNTTNWNNREGDWTFGSFSTVKNNVSEL